MALPLIGAQLLAVANGLVDTLVAGQLGAVEIAACGLGASLLFIVLIGGTGLIAGLSPIMARHIGRGQILEVGHWFRQGLWLALVLGVFGFLLISGIRNQVDHFGFEANLVPLVRVYLDAARWCLVPALLLLVPRNVCEASGRTRPVLLITSIGLALNIISDLGLGLGWFGLPKLGLAGIAWSTSVVNIGMCLVLLWRVNGKGFRRFALYQPLFVRPDRARLARLLKLSLPICITILFETGLFVAISMQMGMLGTLAASAHSIAITVASLFFMLPLGLSFALTARIGVALGRESGSSIRLRTANGLMIAFVMSLCSALVLLLFRHRIPMLFTDDAEVRALAATLLLFAAVFQVSDAMQIAQIGLLRGLHDTRVPMLINGASYWLVGFCAGAFAAHGLDFGAAGLWAGLIAGLSTAAVLLAWRLRYRLDIVAPPDRRDGEPGRARIRDDP